MPENSNAFFWEITPARIEAIQNMIDEDDIDTFATCMCPDCVALRGMLNEARAHGLIAPAVEDDDAAE
jgi:hypothetical protein